MRAAWAPLAALLAILTACGSAAPSAPASSAPAPASSPAAAAAKPSGSAAAPASAAASAKPEGAVKLTVGLSQVVGQFLPAWVAKDAGVYARHGLDVDQRTATATATTASLLSGELQVAVTGGPETLNAIANGADLVMAGNLAPVAALKFVVAPSIKTDQDLVGKAVGITRIGSTTHSNSRALFAKIGINPDKDVQYVQLDTSANEAAALISGQIQAALLSPPENTRLEAQGFRTMYDLSQLNFPASGQLLIMPRAWLNANRDTAQKFVDSIVDARTLVGKDKPTAVASLKKGMKLDDNDAANAVYDYYNASILAKVPYVKPDDIANDLQVIVQATGKLKDADPNKFMDNSLVKSAEDSGLAK